MLDLAMDIPMLLDTTTLARGLLMPSPRLRLILLFFMVPIMAVWGRQEGVPSRASRGPVHHQGQDVQSEGSRRQGGYE